MSARKKRPPARPPASGVLPAPRARRPSPRGRLLVVLAGVAAAALLLQLARTGRRPATPASPLTPLALADSMRTAVKLRDWTRAHDFSARWARAEPGNTHAIRNLAAMMHNCATASTPGPDGERPALRTSLDRIESEIRVHTLFDSASVVATDPDDWARAQLWLGMSLERLGLPIHALAIYTTIREQAPGYDEVQGHIVRVARLLANPLADPVWKKEGTTEDAAAPRGP